MGCIIAISIASPLVPEIGEYVLVGVDEYIGYLVISPAIGAQIDAVRIRVEYIPESTGNPSLACGSIAISRSIPIARLEIKGEIWIFVDCIVVHRNTEEIRPALRPAASIVIAILYPMGRAVKRREVIAILSIHVIVAVLVYHHVRRILFAGGNANLSSVSIISSNINGWRPGNCGLIAVKSVIIEEIVRPP